MKPSGLHELTWLKSFEWWLDSSLLRLKQRSQHSQRNSDVSTSLVVQWIRICLPLQGPWVQSPVWEDSSSLGAAKPLCHNYWAHATTTEVHVPTACALQQEKPPQFVDWPLQWRVAPALHNWRKPRAAAKIQCRVCIVRNGVHSKVQDQRKSCGNQWGLLYHP